MLSLRADRPSTPVARRTLHRGPARARRRHPYRLSMERGPACTPASSGSARCNLAEDEMGHVEGCQRSDCVAGPGRLDPGQFSQITVYPRCSVPDFGPPLCLRFAHLRTHFPVLNDLAASSNRRDLPASRARPRAQPSIAVRLIMVSQDQEPVIRIETEDVGESWGEEERGRHDRSERQPPGQRRANHP
jgi:hypothetical protein